MENQATDTLLLKMVAAEMHFSNQMKVAQGMFGKSYFALGMIEKAAVDQAAIVGVASNFQQITPEFLRGPALGSKMGFHQVDQDKKS